MTLEVKFDPSKKTVRWIEGTMDIGCPVCHQITKVTVNTKPGSTVAKDDTHQEPIFRGSARGLEAILIGDCKCGVTFERVEKVHVPSKT